MWLTRYDRNEANIIQDIVKEALCILKRTCTPLYLESTKLYFQPQPKCFDTNCCTLTPQPKCSEYVVPKCENQNALIQLVVPYCHNQKTHTQLL